jgi:hypothetical protein
MVLQFGISHAAKRIPRPQHETAAVRRGRTDNGRILGEECAAKTGARNQKSPPGSANRLKATVGNLKKRLSAGISKSGHSTRLS